MAGHGLDDLRGIDPSSIFLVHLNDLPSQANYRSLILRTRRERVFPGQGHFPLTTFLATLSTLGYDGYISVEVFPSPVAALDLRQIATTAYLTASEQMDHVQR
jgi:4-hydroxyphenylpyruvate dioxygenase